MFSLRFQPAADRDVERILRDGVQLFGPTQASRYGRDLQRRITALLDFPALHPERPEIGEGVRVMPHKAHVILYRIEEDTVLILRVRHGREDWRSD